MFLTVHVASGLLIGKHLDSSLLAFILGFISHIILDAIPHAEIEIENSKQNKKLLLFNIVSFIELPIIIFLLSSLSLTEQLVWNWPMFWAIIGVIIPDFLWPLGMLFPKIKIFKMFEKLNNLNHSLLTKKIIYVNWKIWLPLQISLMVIFLITYLIT